MARPKKRATYEDLCALPEGTRAELMGGEIVTLPAPMPRHLSVRRALGRFVGGPFDDDDGYGGPGGWWLFPECDVRLGENVVRPDMAGWRRERLPSPDVRPIDVVPDWICEVVSPSNEAYDRVTKRRLYAASGVAFYWIVDTEARTLEAYELRDARWVEVGTYDENDLARIAPFEAVELPIARLFLPPHNVADAGT